MTPVFARLDALGPRRLRLISGAIMGVGLILWSVLTIWTGNMVLAHLFTIALATAAFAVLMVRARQLEEAAKAQEENEGQAKSGAPDQEPS